MADRLAWGILSTGRIAGIFARALAHSETGVLVAVGSRTPSAAEHFGEQHHVPHRHGSYEALLADPDVQAVYIATPHPMHAEWAIKAAEAGKHILCEKPLTLNHAEAMAVIEAAREHDVFLMEAFMYRCHPQTAKLIELIRSEAIGEVRLIQATFSFKADFDDTGRICANELGGGGILDVGCYCTSMARLIAGVAGGQGFAEPVEVKGTGHLCETGTDAWALASLSFPGGILASLATGILVNQESVVRVFGSEGHILVPQPWVISLEGGTSRLILHRDGEPSPQEIRVETPRWLYAIEADTVAEHLRRRQAPGPAMTWEDTLGNMKTLDRWRASIGLVYQSEQPEAGKHPVHRRSLKRREVHNMKYGHVSGVDGPVSRLVMGVDHQTTMPHAAVMFDDFFERGGNSFDTAHGYGGGMCERLLGCWLRHRGVREEVVILDKGGHTPWCTPKDIGRQIVESLERLQTDYIDVYMLHRDNADVGVDEFIGVLNEHKAAGHLRVFGVSNWSIERVDAANDYANDRDLDGISVISNQFSLARMVQPVWPGCLSASDLAARTWHSATQTPLMAWSSQARGFFHRARPEDLSDRELVRCWYCEDNFERLRRARRLAEKLKVPVINVALAYVLCQPFPTFALIGPRTLAETRTSLPALDIELSVDDLMWLNLEA
ncbi:MAG: aldo/keto reductase [Phycisphaerae bacterium]|nr:aldo/keto reductase [Phycisphaerae bacterium]